MTTLTASLLRTSPPTCHTGVQVTGGAYSQSATLTAASILKLCQVPNKSTLVDFMLRIHTGGAAQTVQLGTSNSASGIMAVTSLSGTFSISAGTSEVITFYGDNHRGYLRAPGGPIGGTANDLMPVRISLSDDAVPANVWVEATLGVAISASAYFTFLLWYTMDGLKGHTTIR